MNILLDNGWGDGDHEAVSWPFEWYLRDYQNRRYYTKTIDPNINLADYPVLLARDTNLDPIQTELQQLQLPDLQAQRLVPRGLQGVPAPIRPASPGHAPLRGALAALRPDRPDAVQSRQSPEAAQVPGVSRCAWRYRRARDAVLRQQGHPGARPGAAQRLGARQFGSGRGARDPASRRAERAARHGPADRSPTAPPSTARSPDGSPALSDPEERRGWHPTVGIYVVEGKPARVTRLQRRRHASSAAWAGQAQGDGQFQEPWGIAVAPNGNVYVADTWNHRVQYFDPSGKFLGKWGRLGDAKGSADTDPGVFWGPRAIAISPAGEVYVTDTGNKRVQVFGLDGTFKRMFGGDGSAPGQFNEQVGLSLEPRATSGWPTPGTAASRSSSPNGEPLAADCRSSGWESQNVTNKPYLAVDGDGQCHRQLPGAGSRGRVRPRRPADQRDVARPGSSAGRRGGRTGRPPPGG